jgi:hypothetical protein
MKARHERMRDDSRAEVKVGDQRAISTYQVVIGAPPQRLTVTIQTLHNERGRSEHGLCRRLAGRVPQFLITNWHKGHPLAKLLLLSVTLLALLVGGGGCAKNNTSKTPLQKVSLDPLPSVTLHIHRTLLARGTLLKDLSGPHVDPRSVHLAAGQPFPYSNNKIYLRVRDRKGGAELYALDIPPAPWIVLTDDPKHASFKPSAVNIFETDAATFANTDRLSLYPQGKELSSTSMDGGTSFRFLEHGYLMVQRPARLGTSTATDVIAFRDIAKVSFERNLHISRIVMERRAPAPSSDPSITLGLPMGGSELRQQCDDLEAKLTRQANLPCEEHYSSSGVRTAWIFPLGLLVGAMVCGMSAANQKDFLSCVAALLTIVLAVGGIIVLGISLLTIFSDPALSSFLR